MGVTVVLDGAAIAARPVNAVLLRISLGVIAHLILLSLSVTFLLFSAWMLAQGLGLPVVGNVVDSISCLLTAFTSSAARVGQHTACMHAPLPTPLCYLLCMPLPVQQHPQSNKNSWQRRSCMHSWLVQMCHCCCWLEACACLFTEIQMQQS